MAGKFTAQVEAWVEKTKGGLKRVTVAAVSDTIDEMRRPQFAGGRLPYKTGRLHDSLETTIDGVKAGLGAFTVGKTIRAAFTVDYAVFQEYGTRHFEGNLFREGAVMKWKSFVERAAKAERARR